MPLLSKVAQLVTDYRAARASVAIMGAAGSTLSPTAALAQDANAPVQTAQVGALFFPVGTTSVKPPMPLGPHCHVIKAAFELVEFDGAYAKRANTWLSANCQGDVPVPEPGRNMQRLNFASEVLSKKFDIRLTP